MTRRLLFPVCAFALIAALVVGGLGWVTVASLRVEQAHREATARADRLNKERLALWRLDGQMLALLAPEGNRPPAHYAAPAEVGADVPPRHYTPLLSADLPDWMLLHFQLDPAAGWQSPQVIPADLAARLRSLGLPLGNVTPDRERRLSELSAKFPPAAVVPSLGSADAFFAAADPAVRAPAEAPERAIPQLDLDGMFRAPVPAPQAPPLPGAAPQAAQAEMWNAPAPAAAPQPGAAKPQAAELQQSVDTRGEQAYRYQLSQQLMNSANGLGLTPEPDAGRNRPADLAADADSGRKARAGPVPVDQPPPPAGPPALAAGKPDAASRYFHRGTAPGVADNPAGEAKYAKEKTESLQRSIPAGGAVGNRAELTKQAKEKLEEFAKDADRAAGKGVAGAKPDVAAGGFGGGVGSFGGDRMADALGRLKAPPRPPTPATPPATAAPVAEKTAEVERMAAAPARGLNEFGLRDAAPDKPPTTRLGPLLPRWLIAADGTEALVLVRAAQTGPKTVYQGVLLDWPKLQQSLAGQVADLFPNARLVPARPGESPPPEETMTALPARLDPGPGPSPSPAGWTPLRVGLALAWAAALVALTAVAVGGAALVGLSERRIRFVSAVTHELRTPLTSLRLYLDLLASGMITDEQKQKEYIATLAAESERLHRLIENVLDFARLEKRAVQAHVRPVPVSELLDEVRGTWADRLAADGKELVVVSTLPADRAVQADPRVAAQILGNLVDNARKYSRDAADGRVWVWARPGERGRVAFEVEDRGPGVPPRDRRGLFRPFRRGAAADTPAGGAGLGLALARQWAEVMGGRLSYRPADGGTGACFRLVLPGVT